MRVIAALLFLSVACSPTAQPDPVSRAGQTNESSARKTSAVLAVAATIPSLSISFTGNGGGGGYAFTELYEQGLVTTGTTTTAPEPRIAAELPSLDKGTAQVMPDGKMRVTWKIRPEVRWADGVDLTARDYAFGFEVLKDPANPLGGATLVVNIGPRVDSLEVVDDKTFVMTWGSPFYLFDSIGFHALQPLPSHVLRGIWDERNMDAMLNHSYWRGDYFQVGPYRPVKFEPGVELVLRSVPNYFLGKPRLDTLTIKQYGDANTLFVAVLAGAIDMTADNALAAEHAVELKAQWERSGAGTVYIGYGVSRGLFPQFSPGLQAEPAMLDPRVRQALYHAVDRESWTDVLLGGMRQNTSHSLLPPDHPLYEFTRNSLQAYSFDPQRALRGLGELGWRRVGDGMLTNQTDGRRFPVAVAVTEDSEDEGVLLADMWKSVGLDTSIAVTSNAQRANREHRQAFTGVEITSRGYGDAILTRAQCAESAVAPRFSGSNGGHYCDQRMEQLIEGYTRSLTRADQGRMIGEIARLHAEDLPAMQLYFRFSNPTVVRGLNALANDFAGGIQAGGYYGSYFRNAHLWEWTS